MKTRLGFVSNSSSSSFIVASKEKPKIVVEIDISSFCSETNTMEDVNDRFLEYYSYDSIEEMLKEEGDYCIEKYNKCQEEILKGNTIYFGDVANDDGDPNSEFIYNHGFGNGPFNFVVIQEPES